MVQVLEDVFGTCIDPLTQKEETIRRFTITNRNKISIQVINYGATITSIKMPDKNGKIDDICLGFDNVGSYQQPLSSNPYIGCTVGRVCSRIGNGRFELNGRTVEVSKNFLGKHFLHGGNIGFGQVVWHATLRKDGVLMTFCSPDGHEGFPGQVGVKMNFSLTEDNQFRFCIEAETTKPTPVNMTNHAYFNLAGHNTGKKTMCEHVVTINAASITEKDADTIPTGALITLNENPLDLRTPTNVGEGLKAILPEPGYDDNYVLEWKPNQVIQQAKAYHPPTGRYMEISSNQPGMHFYTSHNMPAIPKGEAPTIFGKDGALYEKHGSFCMETHWYPDAVNHPEFPSVILNPGKKYQHICIFKLGLKNQKSISSRAGTSKDAGAQGAGSIVSDF